MPHTCSCGLHEHTLSSISADSTARLLPLQLRPELTEELLAELVSTRRAVHCNPELSFFEKETAALVAARLGSLGGYEITEGVAPGHGVVALLRGGGGDGPTIALRADMDALPIQEEAGAKAFASRNPGVMHACGHDGHVAILLGVARVLAAAAPRLRGAVKLIFQPAEENSHPELGPFGGAHEMVAAGVMDGVDSLYGLHLWSYEPVGAIRVAPGPVMAACTTFHVEIKGEGGHGAAPQHCVDSVVVAAALVMQLQTIVSRSHDPLERAVLTVGAVSAGTAAAPNVIPQTASLHGTARTFTSEARATTERRLREICAGVAATYGASIDVRVEHESPAVVNDQRCAERVVSAAKLVCPGQGRVTAAQPTMAAEDVSFFMNKAPGCFFFVGSAPGGVAVSHHKPEFDIDERSLGVGASVLIQVVEDLLGGE